MTFDENTWEDSVKVAKEVKRILTYGLYPLSQLVYVPL